MRFLSDEAILAGLARAYGNAKNAPKEGRDTGRGHGEQGRIADEWMRWRDEALRRGLVA